MKPFRTEPEASDELAEAAVWYEGKREGLGLEFLEAVDAALEFIGRFAQAGSPVPLVPKDLPIRRVPVRRFPFHVVYLEMSNAIRVLAFAHDHRRPGYWLSRI
jgi:hypothetical protein